MCLVTSRQPSPATLQLSLTGHQLYLICMFDEKSPLRRTLTRAQFSAPITQQKCQNGQLRRTRRPALLRSSSTNVSLPSISQITAQLKMKPMLPIHLPVLLPCLHVHRTMYRSENRSGPFCSSARGIFSLAPHQSCARAHIHLHIPPLVDSMCDPSLLPVPASNQRPCLPLKPYAGQSDVCRSSGRLVEKKKTTCCHI